CSSAPRTASGELDSGRCVQPVTGLIQSTVVPVPEINIERRASTVTSGEAAYSTSGTHLAQQLSGLAQVHIVHDSHKPCVTFGCHNKVQQPFSRWHSLTVQISHTLHFPPGIHCSHIRFDKADLAFCNRLMGV